MSEPALAVLLSLAAATLFALTTNLHRQAASAIPVTEVGPVRLLLRLLRTPRWLVGSAAALAALGLHALALHFGTVIVVQAVLSTGLVLALATEAFRERRRPRPVEVASWVLVVAGIMALLSMARPHGGRDIGLGSLVLALVLAAVVAAAGLLVGRTSLPQAGVAVVMGAAAGTCFALDAVFLKALSAGEHLLGWRSLLDLGGFLLASVLGNLVVQRAYQRAPLRHVLPAVTAADPLAATVVGITLLHEHLHPGYLAVAGLVGGLAAMVVGIVGATSAAPGGELPDGPPPAEPLPEPVPGGPAATGPARQPKR